MPHVSENVVAPAVPLMAADRVGALQILMGLGRNAYSAFPRRCIDEPVIKLRLAGRHLVVATAPEAIRHVMIVCAEDYVRLPVGRRVLGPIVGRGLLVSEGETWRRQRRAMAPAFTPRNIPMMARHIARCADIACDRIERSVGTPVDLLEEVQMLSLEIAASSLFSMEAATFGPKMRELVGEYMGSVGRLYLTDILLPDFVPSLLRARRSRFRRRWTQLIHSTIELRRGASREGDAAETNTARDLFDLLSEVHGAEDQDLLADEVSTMIVAGHETTALTLFWMCTLLAKAPQWQERLATEARALDLSPEGAAASLPNLVLTRAVVEETLRLYSPAFMTARLANRSHEICGTLVPANSIVLLPYWILHRNPRWWSRPEVFDPSRFLNGAEPERLTYLPFGIGRHVCIGAQLAMTEAILAMARLVSRFSMTMEEGRPLLPVGRLSTRPSHSPRFVLQPR